MKEIQLRRLKIGPIEAEWGSRIDSAGREVADALAQMPIPASDGPVPASLVDLIDDINKNPRQGMRAAFHLIRRALDISYPQLAEVASSQLPRAMRDLVRRGILNPEVERAVGQLNQLLELVDSGADAADNVQGYQFLMMAEGAIHGILRSSVDRSQDNFDDPRADSVPPPIRSSWSGSYNNDFTIELLIQKWKGSKFEGLMNYPGSGTVTQVEGGLDGRTVTWTEIDYNPKGDRQIDFDGRYEATVSVGTMTGAWYQGDRRVARFRMEATEVDTLSS